MNKIYGYLKISLVIVVFIFFAQPILAQTLDRPNILFILVDDLGMMELGHYNPNTFYETPNIDRLGDSGVTFTDSYAVNLGCSPSRYAIMTGKYPSRHDATDWFCGGGYNSGRFLPPEINCYMPVEEVTIAEALNAGGYSTFFAGKWHLGEKPEHWPENQGFDINKGGWGAGSPTHQPGEKDLFGGGGYFSPYNNPRLKDGPEGEFLTERLAEETIHFLQTQQEQEEPFFAFLSFYQVHTPLEAPVELVEKYEEKAEKMDLNNADIFVERVDPLLPVDTTMVRVIQSHPVYAAMVESVDRAVGSVLEELNDLGFDDDTVVIFTSDDGGLSDSRNSPPTSNLPLRGGKGLLYEGGSRVPLIIRWPGVTSPGNKISVPVIGTDFYPTLLEIADLPLNEAQHMDGVSFVSLLRDEEPAIERDALYWHYPHYSVMGGFPGGTIRMKEWKLIERYDENGQVYLYNLQEDIEEQKDLADRHPELVKRMRRKLHKWYKEVDAKFLRAREGGPEPWSPGN